MYDLEVRGWLKQVSANPLAVQLSGNLISGHISSLQHVYRPILKLNIIVRLSIIHGDMYTSTTYFLVGSVVLTVLHKKLRSPAHSQRQTLLREHDPV